MALDINLASFTEITLLTDNDSITRKSINDAASNAAYNNRRGDQNLFIENDEYTAPSADKTYDTGRNYGSKYLRLEIGLKASAFVMPFGINSTSTELTTEWIQLTTSFQTLPENAAIQIRAEANGGFTIRVTVASGSRFLLGSITESRKVVGA